MPDRVVISTLPGALGDLGTLLRARGLEVVTIPADLAGWTPAMIKDYAATADALVGTFQSMRLPRHVLEVAERLRVVVSPVIGTEHIDVEAATELGIAVGYGATPENYLGVAEAVIMLIAVMRKEFLAKYETVRTGGWRSAHPGAMVRHATIGLVGFGNIGRGVARRLAGWECEVIATDPYIDPAVAPPLGVRLVDLDTLLKTADAVVMLVTLTSETRHMIGATQFAMMKPGSMIINVSRGGVIDESALILALNEGQLAGAAIDTWEREPAPLDDPMREHPRIIVTGHNIGHSQEAYDSLPVAAVENVIRGLRGEPLLHFRNPEVLPAWRERLARLANIASQSPSK